MAKIKIEFESYDKLLVDAIQSGLNIFLIIQMYPDIKTLRKIVERHTSDEGGSVWSEC